MIYYHSPSLTISSTTKTKTVVLIPSEKQQETQLNNAVSKLSTISNRPSCRCTARPSLKNVKKKNESNRYRKYQHISLQPMKCLLANKSEHGDNPIKRMSENATKHLTIRFNTGQHAKKRYRTHRLISYYGSQGSTSVTNHRDINKIEFMSVTPSRDRKQKQAYPSSTSSRG